MSFIEIHKEDLLSKCKNEIEEEILFNELFENKVSFQPFESKYGVTSNKFYDFFKSEYDNEFVFIDDEKEESVAWIAVDGIFLLDKREIKNNILEKIY